MARLYYGTQFVSEDEGCLSLRESNYPTPSSKGLHRYQIVFVNRGGSPAEYRMDMGDAKLFGDEGFYIPGGGFDQGKYLIEHTVGQLRDIANWLRSHKIFDVNDYAGIEPNKPIKIPDRRRRYA